MITYACEFRFKGSDERILFDMTEESRSRVMGIVANAQNDDIFVQFVTADRRRIAVRLGAIASVGFLEQFPGFEEANRNEKEDDDELYVTFHLSGSMSPVTIDTWTPKEVTGLFMTFEEEAIGTLGSAPTRMIFIEDDEAEYFAIHRTEIAYMEALEAVYQDGIEKSDPANTAVSRTKRG